METTKITHQTLVINGHKIHFAEAGKGTTIILLHGFPETWYSWRHQLPTLAEAGYRAIAPDALGCGLSEQVDTIESYSMSNNMLDAIGILDAIGSEKGIVVGHDWGALTAWACALCYPNRISAVVGVDIGITSTGFIPRPSAPPVAMATKAYEMLKSLNNPMFDYRKFVMELMLYTQKPGIAEAEYEKDVYKTLLRTFYTLSGEAPVDLLPKLVQHGPLDGSYIDRMPQPNKLPSWLSEDDLKVYVESYKNSGFKGAFNRYRNFDRDWKELEDISTKKVTQPALFITGELDQPTRFVQHEPVSPWIPNLRDMIMFPGCGHWIQQERAEGFNKYLIEFLNSLIL